MKSINFMHLSFLESGFYDLQGLFPSIFDVKNSLLWQLPFMAAKVVMLQRNWRRFQSQRMPQSSFFVSHGKQNIDKLEKRWKQHNIGNCARDIGQTSQPFWSGR